MGGQESKGCSQGEGEIPKGQEITTEVVNAPKEDTVKLPSAPMIAKEEEAPTEASTEDEELTEALQASSPGPSDVPRPTSNASVPRLDLLGLHLLNAEADKRQICGQQRELMDSDLTQSGATEAPTEASTETLEPVEAQFSAGDNVRAMGLQAAAHLNGKVGNILGFDAELSRYVVDFGDGEQPMVKPGKLEKATHRMIAAGEVGQHGTPVKSTAESVDLESETPEKEKKEQQVQTPKCKENWDKAFLRNDEDEIVVLTSDELKDIWADDAVRLSEERKAAKNKKTAAFGAMTLLLALNPDA